MNARNVIAKLGPFLGLLLVIALFSIPHEVRGYFLTYSNFKIILTQTVIVAIGALGMTLIIVSGGIDLSVGSTIAFTGVVGALLIQHGYPTMTVVAVVIASGAVIGLLNGVLIAGLRMMPFIITLGTLSIVRGAAQLLGNNETVYYDSSPINNWMTTSDLASRSLPAGAWVMLVAAVATAVLLRQTVLGRHIFAIGSNEATARLCGVPTVRTKIIIYSLAGGFFGLAGLMQMSRLHVGDPTVAAGLELDIIAAVIIGGASLNGGVGTVMGSMIGAFIMAVLRNSSGQMGWPTPVQLVIIGVVIIAADFLDRLRQSKNS